MNCTVINRFRVASILSFIIILFASCDAKDDANALINTQFASEVVDSCHILSPKTYTYLQNIKPPLGIKPVIVVVEQIKDNQMGTYADNLFEQYCKKKHSGNTFKERGILIVASKDPQLVQVRVGKTYAVYCRMRGSAAGADYLAMQKETPNIGIDEMCPIVLRNTIQDIEQCRNLPWYKKIALKMSFENVEMFFDDVATPSESFFSQFYFRPFIFLVGTIKSLFDNWVLSFLFISIVYILSMGWIGKKLDAYVEKKAAKHSNDDEDYLFTLNLYNNIKAIGVFIFKLFVIIPTLAAISVLSTSRMEDIIALRDANIPSVELIENVTHWSNSTPGLLLVLLLITVYYCKFLLSIKGFLTLSLFSNKVQQTLYNNNNISRMLLDEAITNGINRNFVQRLFKGVSFIVLNAFFHHNFQEINDRMVVKSDEEGEKTTRLLIDCLFLDRNASLYKEAPFLAILVNTHREALCLSFFVGLIAISVLSYTYAVYFLILWSVQLVYRLVIETRFALKEVRGRANELAPFKLIRTVGRGFVIFLFAISLLFLIMSPSYTPKNIEKVAEVQNSLPNDLTGLYFVQIADGKKVKGVSARIEKDNNNNYILQVYGNTPMRRYSLQLDEKEGYFTCNVLGTGYITYDEQAKSTTINFSDLWIFTN